jgi:hypothetical protein
MLKSIAVPQTILYLHSIGFVICHQLMRSPLAT